MHWIVLTVLLCGAPVSAYVRLTTKTGVSLFRPDAVGIQFLVNPSVQAGAVNAQGEVMITPASDPVSALAAAAASWNAVDTAISRFLPLQATSLSNNPSDGNHVITIEDTPENRSVTGSLVAVTVLQYTASGAVMDTDIIINPAAAFSTDHSQGTYDLQAVITHELGHALGANHSGLISATMFASTFPFAPFVSVAEATTQATLSADDAAFVTEAYPSADADVRLGTVAGTVALADGVPVAGALVAAIDPSTGVSVGGFASLTDGNFWIARVPPGNYLVYAHPLDGPVFPFNLALAATAAPNTTFRSTFFGGNDSPVNVAIGAGDNAQAGIVVDPAPTALTLPFLGFGPADGNGWGYLTGANAVASGGPVDLYLWGAGIDSHITASQIRLIGPGMTIRPDTVTSVPDAAVAGMTPLRFTVDIAAIPSRTIASVAVIDGTDGAIYSGGLVLLPAVPPTSRASPE
jgi:carboxypeptidase family protein/matrixin